MAQTETNKRAPKRKRPSKPPTERSKANKAQTNEDPGDGNVSPTATEAEQTSLVTDRIVAYRNRDDLKLVARVFGERRADTIPILCLAGLTRNSKDFLALGHYFSRHAMAPRQVIALDYRGRGLSDYDKDWRNYSPVVEAQDVLDSVDALGVEECILVGTSRGGILAMLLGSMRPGLMKGIVLNDIGPVIEGTGLARIKSYLGARTTFKSFESAEAALRQAMQGGFPKLTDSDWRAFTKAMFVEEKGGVRPDYDKSLNRQLANIDFSEDVPQLWPQFLSLSNIPVLGIRGENSDLLSPKTFQEMAEKHPRFESLTVPDQAHAPLLTDPPTLERIRAFATRRV